MKALISFLPALLVASHLNSQEIYKGQSQNKMPHGFGVTDFEDGSYYQGIYKYGIENGPGTFCDANGLKQTGIFQNGELVGEFEVVPNTRLMDFIYEIDSETVFESMRIDIDFANKPVKKKNLIVAPFGSFRINGQIVSAGFITNTKGFTNINHEKKGLYPYDIESAVYFKTYGERRSNTMIPLKYGYCESGANDGTNQGEFVSVLKDFEWKKGSYGLQIYKSCTIKIKKELFTVLTLNLITYDKNETIIEPVGSLAFPGTELVLETELSHLISTHTKRCFISEIPSMEIKLKSFFVNEQPQSFIDAKCKFDYYTPQFALANLVDDYNGAVFKIGEAFKLISGSFLDDYYYSFFIYNQVFEENE